MVEFTLSIQRESDPKSRKPKVRRNFIDDLIPTVSEQTRREVDLAHFVSLDNIDAHRIVVIQTGMNKLHLKVAALPPQGPLRIKTNVAIFVIRQARQKLGNRRRRAKWFRRELLGSIRDAVKTKRFLGV